MPAYDYDCAACGRRVEVVHGVHAPAPTACPNCGGGPLKKAFAPPAIHFKGSGWAKKERRASQKTGSARDSGADDSKDSSKADKPSGDGDAAPASTPAATAAPTSD